ncbi:peptide deformylase 1b [Quercus suber]|uniref:Peptide deformylase n=1 Tax=Quercus suber TaxID=58331 RepID=A0AAW0K3V5_QUESU
MACKTWLHSFSLVPILHRRSSTLPAMSHLLNRSSQSGRLFSSSANRPSPTPVHTQAKRGFSSKNDDVAVASPEDVRFQAPLKIVEYPDPILRAKNKRIDSFDDNLQKLVHEMFDVITDGIGLSAPQVGINVQLMVFNPVGERGEGEEIVLVNPRVYKYSKKMVLFNEGCLSFPGINADVVRPETVKIDARDIKGARFTVSLSDLPARVFQHEFDHLQMKPDRLQIFTEEVKQNARAVEVQKPGILFFDRMSDEVLDSIRTELQNLLFSLESIPIDKGEPAMSSDNCSLLVSDAPSLLDGIKKFIELKHHEHY